MRNRDLASDYVWRADVRLGAIDVLFAERERLPEGLHGEVEKLARISKELRRDRELAFEGTEDLTPSAFYSREDAVAARESARTTVGLVQPFVTGPARPERS